MNLRKIQDSDFLTWDEFKRTSYASDNLDKYDIEGFEEYMNDNYPADWNVEQHSFDWFTDHLDEYFVDDTPNEEVNEFCVEMCCNGAIGIVKFFKKDGKWFSVVDESDDPDFEYHGSRYMGYLTKEAILEWLHKDRDCQVLRVF